MQRGGGGQVLLKADTAVLLVAQYGRTGIGTQDSHFAMSCSVPSPPLSAGSSALLVHISPISNQNIYCLNAFYCSLGVNFASIKIFSRLFKTKRRP